MSKLQQTLESIPVITQSDANIMRITADINEYLVLLQKWNKAYNLTAIRDFDDMLKLHILDSLAILPYVNGNNIIDVGTGPGLPGMILAIAKPDLQVTLLDSNGKKIRFLQEVKRVLSLNNVEIIHSRVLDYHPQVSFDTVVSRAFASIKKMQVGSRHLLAENGIWLAMKGREPQEELAVVTSPYQIKSYQIPGVSKERCCVILTVN